MKKIGNGSCAVWYFYCTSFTGSSALVKKKTNYCCLEMEVVLCVVMEVKFVRFN